MASAAPINPTTCSHAPSHFFLLRPGCAGRRAGPAPRAGAPGRAVADHPRQIGAVSAAGGEPGLWGPGRGGRVAHTRQIFAWHDVHITDGISELLRCPVIAIELAGNFPVRIKDDGAEVVGE